MLKKIKNHSLLFLIVFSFLLFFMEGHSQNDKSNKKVIIEKTLSFQQILDSSNVIGSILVFDPQSNSLYSNDFDRCRKGFLPASTFKIVNSIIALELGIVSSDTSVLKWNGEKRRLSIWEKDLTFKEAFQVSCVPCFQEIARKIGHKRMNEYLHKLNYKNMFVDSTNIDLFWLEGKSVINMYEQIDFLNRFYFSLLPISKRTEIIMKQILIIDKNTNYTFSGKTGWAIKNDNNIGWFVGYLEAHNKVFFVATNIEPHEKFNMDLFPKIRTNISLRAFEALKLF